MAVVTCRFQCCVSTMKLSFHLSWAGCERFGDEPALSGIEANVFTDFEVRDAFRAFLRASTMDWCLHQEKVLTTIKTSGIYIPTLRSDDRSVYSGRLLEAVDDDNMGIMTKVFESILAEDLKLNPQTRAELVAELLVSLDGPGDADAAIAWDEEIHRRVDALEAGTEKLESWESAKRGISTDILGR